MPVKHHSYMIENGPTTTVTTLCGRFAGDGDLNVADSDDEVTCKICLAAMNNPNNWRWVKYQKYGIKA